MPKINIKDITEDINDRMKQYPHSMAPTDDEVSIAYLTCRIADFRKVIEEVKSLVADGTIAQNLSRVAEITTVNFDR